MTETQQRAIAAGFLHALETSPDLYHEWQAIAKDNLDAIGALVQKTMGLQTAPTKSDLDAMANYVDAALKSNVASIQAANANAPRHVGFIVFLMQQN